MYLKIINDEPKYLALPGSETFSANLMNWCIFLFQTLCFICPIQQDLYQPVAVIFLPLYLHRIFLSFFSLNISPFHKTLEIISLKVSTIVPKLISILHCHARQDLLRPIAISFCIQLTI